jgi:hypothetical protein
MIELGKWGSQFLPPSLEGVAPPSLGASSLAIKAFFRPEQARGMSETFEFDFGNEVLQVQVRDGAILAQQGLVLDSEVVIYLNMDIFVALFTGQLNPSEAISTGLVRVEGDPDALSRFFSFTGVRTSSVNSGSDKSRVL